MNLIYDIIDINAEPGLRLKKNFSELKATEKIAVDFMANDIINEYINMDGCCDAGDLESFAATADYIAWQNDIATSAEWVTRVRINDVNYVFDSAYITRNGCLILVVAKVKNISRDDCDVAADAEDAEKIYFNVRY